MKIAIYGYGNLGRGVELAVRQNPDAELVGVFTRRAPETVKTAFADTRVFAADSLDSFVGKIDVLIICGGSATDLPVLTPLCARKFNVVDSFDTHARIPSHFEAVDKAAKEGGTVAVISSGWDPGLFSIARLYASAALPAGQDYTFWGKGISQGHSDAIRRVDGVLDARQYTIPKEEAVAAVRRGEQPALSTSDKHLRECFVVLKEGADARRVEETIRNMPNYFKDYETVVHFISREQLLAEHGGMPHGGSVIRCGKTGEGGEHSHTVEFSLRLGSNPEFTASVLVATARAAYRKYLRGEVGCKTLFDLSPADLSPLSPETLREKML